MRWNVSFLILVVISGQWTILAQDNAPQCATVVEIADKNEPGERLYFGGRILDYQGQSLSEAAVVAYHADATGVYNPPNAGTRIPRLRAVAVTDEAGLFCFSTILPRAYPNTNEPAHIHLEITAPAHRLRYVTYWFDNDPFITEEQQTRAESNEEIVIVSSSKDENGNWTFFDEIRLAGN
jgi:protocatechuate 3,4-dioxygenase beta subunit